jgi:hypothetical protein
MRTRRGDTPDAPATNGRHVIDAEARCVFVFARSFMPISGHHPYESPGEGPRPFGEQNDFVRYESDLYRGDPEARVIRSFADHTSVKLALRTGRHKVIVDTDTNRTELYDLVRDPGEQHDISREDPARVAMYRADLEHWSTSQRSLLSFGAGPPTRSFSFFARGSLLAAAARRALFLIFRALTFAARRRQLLRRRPHPARWRTQPRARARDLAIATRRSRREERLSGRVNARLCRE